MALCLGVPTRDRWHLWDNSKKASSHGMCRASERKGEMRTPELATAKLPSLHAPKDNGVAHS